MQVAQVAQVVLPWRQRKQAVATGSGLDYSAPTSNGLDCSGVDYTWSNSHSDEHTDVINYVSRAGNVCVLELFKCMALTFVNVFGNYVHCAGNHHVLNSPAAGE